MTSGLGRPAQQPAEQHSAPELANTVLQKRTEWLEGQERKMAAAVQEQYVEQERLTEHIAESKTELESIKTALGEMQQRVVEAHCNSLSVYGKIGHMPLMGFLCGTADEEEAAGALRAYYEAKNVMMVELGAPQSWILLTYPMVCVRTGEDGDVREHLMRCRTVDRYNGENRLAWAVVRRTDSDGTHRHVEEFSLCPGLA